MKTEERVHLVAHECIFGDPVPITDLTSLIECVHADCSAQKIINTAAELENIQLEFDYNDE
jgi:hypothetical protein